MPQRSSNVVIGAGTCSADTAVHGQSLLTLLAEQHCAKTVFKMIIFTSNKSNFDHQQRSVALKYAKMRWRPGLCSGPRWGSSRHSPRPPSLLGRGTPHPLGGRRLGPRACCARFSTRAVPLFETFRRP